MSGLVRELRAKAQQSTRTDKRWDDHVAWRGADEIERLRSENAELLEALKDMYNGWLYIRAQYGDLYGVGWDRAQQKAENVIAKHEGTD